MSLVNPYCTVDQLRAYIKNSDSNITATLEHAINAASRFIDEWKGLDYFEHDYSENALVLDRWSKDITGDTIWLPYRPVIEITEVQVNQTVWVEDEDFKIDPAGRLHSYQGYWIGCPSNASSGAEWMSYFRNTPESRVEIKGRFGYEQRAAAVPPAELGALNRALVPSGMPDHIIQACIEIAASASKWNMKDIVGLDGQKTSILATDIPKSAMQLLGTRAKFLV
jgi:hypothetical protein